MNTLFAATTALNFFLQQPDTVEMADQLRADGKIWVVVLVIAVVFAGIIVYLVRLDRQLSKVEKEVISRVSSQTRKTKDIGQL
ncbi:MAG: CcmD family protein [Cytophagales bacterium]|nr:MAG: CcmD family protein [Cytophagales bacterium]